MACFNFKDFVEAESKDEVFVVKRGDVEFALKRLNGEEICESDNNKTPFEKSKYVLGRCLLSGEERKPIGEENAGEFIRKFGAASDFILTKIYQAVNQEMKEERLLWDDAKKNIYETDDSSPTTTRSAVDIVDDMG